MHEVINVSKTVNRSLYKQQQRTGQGDRPACKKIEESCKVVFNEVIAKMTEKSQVILIATDLILIIRDLERITNHLENYCRFHRIYCRRKKDAAFGGEGVTSDE